MLIIIGVIDLDKNERQTSIVGLEELDLSEWRTSFIDQLVELANTLSSCLDELDDFLAESVAKLASTLLEFNPASCMARPKKGMASLRPKSSFGDLLLFWSYCLHRCVCMCVCVIVCVRLQLLQASTL